MGEGTRRSLPKGWSGLFFTTTMLLAALDCGRGFRAHSYSVVGRSHFVDRFRLEPAPYRQYTDGHEPQKQSSADSATQARGRRRFISNQLLLLGYMGAVSSPSTAQVDEMPDIDDQDAAIMAQANAPLQEASVTTTYEEFGSAFTAASGWERLPVDMGGGFKDRFTKDMVADKVAVTATISSLASIADLGAVEKVDVIKTLGLERRLGIGRADLVAAAKRSVSPSSSNSGRGADGTVFYTWDLAAAPPMGQCNEGDQFGGALGCSYDRIILLSATVFEGKLFVLSVLANSDEWKGRGKALRALRDSHRLITALQ